MTSRVLALKITPLSKSCRGTAEFLAWMVEEAGIEPHVPVRDMGDNKPDRFGRFDFHYDSETDSYICPGGKQLLRSRRNYSQPRSGVPKDGFIRYRASQLDCAACSLKAQCWPNSKAGKILRSKHETMRDVARAVNRTTDYQQARTVRKKVEMLFAHMKRILRMDRFRLRGLRGARDEFLLTATAQNLRRMAQYLGTGPPEILETVPI